MELTLSSCRFYRWLSRHRHPRIILTLKTKNYQQSLNKELSLQRVGLITKGIVGCALSHKKAWKKFIDSKEDSYIF